MWDVKEALSRFVTASSEILKDSLKSIVLFGSAAEGRLRATSDVNVILVLEYFHPQKFRDLHDHLSVARAAIRLEAMFLLQKELQQAMQFYSVKFADVLRAHQVLFGNDPFANVFIPREAILSRLRQVVFNLTLRLRSQYLLLQPREEQLIKAIADSAGPLRSFAAALLELEGENFSSKKEALERFCQKVNLQDWKAVLANISKAREEGYLASEAVEATFVSLFTLAECMQDYSLKMS